MPLSPLLLIQVPLILTLLLFLSHRAHLLMTLLALESIILSLIMFSMLTHASAQHNSFFLLLLLTLAACEASLGLALLVIMSRSFGSDLMSTLTMNKC